MNKMHHKLFLKMYTQLAVRSVIYSQVLAFQQGVVFIKKPQTTLRSVCADPASFISFKFKVFISFAMSLIPLMYQDWWDDIDRSSRLFDHNFGLGLRREELLNSAMTNFDSSRLRGSYLRPWRMFRRQASDKAANLDSNTFQVMLDVQQFAPEEITVKTNDRTVIVEGKHEEKADDHGYISRHFVRKYLLPADTDVQQIVSSLSSDGILMVTAPNKQTANGERLVPITPTGPIRPAVTVSPQPTQPLAKVEEINIPVIKQ